ncbi:MAG TPA: NAD(+) synthase [Syntrophomonas sp.]|nr:NAD(+) synthase [Syntrophomonas sp.]
MNCEAVVQHLVNWLREKVKEAGARGVVIGVSGGVDSAVAAVLAQKAFPDNCMALVLPCESTTDDLIHSRLLLDKFNITYRVIELDNVYQLMVTQLESYIKLDGSKRRLLRANLKPRLRMTTMYYSAQARNYLVLGTTNKSELTVGYSTKHGDGGVDLQILGDLLKREVLEIARYLHIPSVIINKTPSGGLWVGQTDEEEMGISYQQLDDYIQYNQGETDVIERIQKLNQISEHKRQMPPIAKISEELRK